MYYRDLLKRVGELQADLVNQFKIDFMDRENFKNFADNLSSEAGGYTQLWITGYFSEAIRDSLEMFARNHKLKLLSQEFDLNNKREKKNLEVLKKLCNSGAEIKVNSRLHA